MARGVPTALRALFLSLVAVVIAASFSTPAHADPAATSAMIEQKKAQKDATVADLQQMRGELDRQVSTYVETARRIAQAEVEVSQVTTQIAQQSSELASAQAEVVDRAVQLYHGDRMGLFRILLSAGSLPQLMDSVSYVIAVNEHDANLIERVRLARQESLWLQETLNQRIQLLKELQASADDQRKRVESDMALEQERAAQLGQDIAQLMRQQRAEQLTANGGTPSVNFAPDYTLNDAIFRDSSSMSAEDIQAFLSQQPGILQSYRGKSVGGADQSAAEMIADAAVAWRVNPRVLLVTLQKEQSLLADPSPTPRQLDWAMGCGKTDSRTFNQYRGFGNQVWFGAKSLNTQANKFRPGMQINIDGSVVTPASSGTYALYRYTPHLHGNMSFWLLHWRYFGDPLAAALN